MSDILVIYDISSKNLEMRYELEKLGYTDCFESDGYTYYLPYGTMWKPEGTINECLQDLNSTAVKVQTKLERAVSLPFDEWAAIVGKTYMDPVEVEKI